MRRIYKKIYFETLLYMNMIVLYMKSKTKCKKLDYNMI